jgi:ubiquinone/menaquinone biosynthesis C-methylase UbiE
LAGSAYANGAQDFERRRALPAGAAAAIRAAVLADLDAPPRPRVLDLGAGTGRVGWPFVASDDDYVGVDLSAAMLRAFAKRRELTPARPPLLIQADGESLPFVEACFDVVLLMQVLNAAHDWRRLLLEAKRVLRPSGSLTVGRTVAPEHGVDARMKRRLGEFLGALGVRPHVGHAVDDALAVLRRAAWRERTVTVASWRAERTPRQFLERHAAGARFSALPAPVRDAAMHQLRDWATTAFGSLDAACAEPYRCELLIFHLEPGRPH